jgi:hypothetical protein
MNSMNIEERTTASIGSVGDARTASTSPSASGTACISFNSMAWARPPRHSSVTSRYEVKRLSQRRSKEAVGNRDRIIPQARPEREKASRGRRVVLVVVVVVVEGWGVSKDAPWTPRVGTESGYNRHSSLRTTARVWEASS